VYILNQWDRSLFGYLYGVPIPSSCGSTHVGDICFQPKIEGGSSALIVGPNCGACPSVNATGYWPNCEACQSCLREKDANKFSLAVDTCIAPSQYGLLVGFGFTIVYITAGLIGGYVSDKANRKVIVALALIIWSAAVLGQGFATEFYGMLGSRALLGLGQAFLAPAAYSLIAAYFPPEKRATANGFYNLGVYVGGALSSISFTLATNYGWRITTWSVAGLGFVVAIVFLLVVKEPEREAQAVPLPKEGSVQAPKKSFGFVLFSVLTNWFVVLLFIASSLRFLGGYAIGSYLPKFFGRNFPAFSNQYGVINGIVTGLGGAISSFGGGKVTDVLATKNGTYMRALIPALGCLIGLPFFAGVVLIPNFYAAMVCLFFEYLFAECWLGPAMAILQSLVEPEIRGTAVALYLFVGTLIGNASPYVLGLLDEKNPSEISIYLLGTVILSYGGAAVLFLILTIAIRRKDSQKSMLDESLLGNDQLKEEKA